MQPVHQSAVGLPRSEPLPEGGATWPQKGGSGFPVLEAVGWAGASLLLVFLGSAY